MQVTNQHSLKRRMLLFVLLLVILGAGFHSARDDEDGDPKVRAVPEPTATTVGQAPVV